MKGQMKTRNVLELKQEITRCESIIKKSSNEKVVRDYTKHLNRCKKDLQEYYWWTTGKHIQA